MNWRAAAQRGIDTERRMKERESRGLQRGIKAAKTIQNLVRKFLKTDYHQSQKKKWERDQRIKERDEKRRKKSRDMYRDSVSSRSDKLNRDRRYIQQIMSKIRQGGLGVEDWTSTTTRRSNGWLSGVFDLRSRVWRLLGISGAEDRRYRDRHGVGRQVYRVGLNKTLGHEKKNRFSPLYICWEKNLIWSIYLTIRSLPQLFTDTTTVNS